MRKDRKMIIFEGGPLDKELRYVHKDTVGYGANYKKSGKTLGKDIEYFVYVENKLTENDTNSKDTEVN